MNKQTGFTLIELAIVLVIIGLLLGGVLRGQELINSAKAKNMVSELNKVQTYIYTYQDKYRALPGDDKAASAHVGVDTSHNGDGDGVIEGAWNATSGTESFYFWEHVRKANLAAGPTDTTSATYLPTNNEGGPIGVQSSPQKTIAGLTGSYAVCTGGVLGKIARQINQQIDGDDDTDTGSVMVATSVDGSTPASAVKESTADFDSTKYVLCYSF
jgi:prepilin-type N-terminal cleavage/methylation domain-containing protein